MVPVRTRRRGNTLLELVAASTVLALALVPALRIMRDSVLIGSDLELSNAMSTLCAGRLEETLAKISATWNTTSEAGNYSSIGYTTLKYAVTKSDAPANGGIVNRLIAVTVTVWEDADGDNVLDTGEKKVQFSGKVAKFATYNQGL